VILGFAFFAVDEMDKGSKAQRTALGEETGTPASPEVVAVAPTPDEEAARERRNSAPRELIDDANDVLLAPFADLIDSDNGWVNHGVPALLALLLYGVGLGLLANMLPKERAHGDDWRAAES
jgi:DNA-binding transcriptional LysR family regulator